MKNLKLLIKFPTRERPDAFLKALDLYYNLADDINNIEFIITCDDDDHSMNNKSIKETLKAYKNLNVFYSDNKTKVEAINNNINNETIFDILLLASDDMIPVVRGYDTLIKTKMDEHYPDGDGVLWFNDGHQKNNLNTLCIFGKKYYDRFGYIYHPSYKSLYCDNEFMEVSKNLNRFIYFDECIIKHMHPAVTNETDSLYQKNDSFYEEDKQKFIQRLKYNFEPRIIAISFASEKFYDAQYKLSLTYTNNVITGSINFTEKMIEDSFKLKNKSIWNGQRGFGYWCWKPYIIIKTMELLDYGDIVIYIDSANRVISNLKFIVDKCKQNDIVLFDNRDGNYEHECWKNLEWTKRDCFNLMGLTDEKFIHGKQINASYQVYKKCEKSLNFLNEYMKFCENENIITDIENITDKNYPEFKDHRHDQSIASLLAIKYDIELLPDPSEWGNWAVDRPYPQLFWHCRGNY
jgi:hypothetical protein